MKITWKKVWNAIIGKQEKKPETTKEKALSFVLTLVWAISVVTIINGLLLASFVVPTGSMERTVLAGDFLFVNKFKYGPSTPQIIPFFNIPLPYYKFPGMSDPEKDDIIVFVYPGNANDMESEEFTYYLKRCVGTAGDTLQVINNAVYIDGQKESFPTTGQKSQLQHGGGAFPGDKDWTLHDFGPVYIPQEGDKLEITQNNYSVYRMLIKREGHEVDFRGDKLYVDGQVTDSYTVERSYCWAMGDNRDNSLDSRSWGFVPWENVVGTPLMIYWSWLPDVDHSSPTEFDHSTGQAKYKKNSFSEKVSNIRWDRIFSSPE